MTHFFPCELKQKPLFPVTSFLAKLASAMTDCPPDLLPLINEARRLVSDDRYIWCATSETFDSRLTQRRGLLLGGAFSPHFLRDSGAMSWDTPWTVRLRHCRVVVCDKAAQAPLTGVATADGSCCRRRRISSCRDGNHRL
jgi:hypothetical protein